MDKNTFLEELKKIDISPTLEQQDLLESYYKLLISWNEKMNLTGIIEEKDVYLKHFYDSATLHKIVDLNQEKSLCDIGTGAGFPGLVLKILFPNLHVTLVDSLHKRITFLKEVIECLSLKEIEIVEARAEEFAINNKEKYDVVTSRAVAPLSLLAEYSIPLVKINKYFIPMKANLSEEKEKIGPLSKTLCMNLEDQMVFELPVENSTRTLLKFKKLSKTPSQYPRRYGEMKKKPL